jgi:hypothetical protein
LIVNPGSPREHQWYIAAAGFEIAAGWATAIAVEHAFSALRAPISGFIRARTSHRMKCGSR